LFVAAAERYYEILFSGAGSPLILDWVCSQFGKVGGLDVEESPFDCFELICVNDNGRKTGLACFWVAAARQKMKDS
jgi:hypothetical protein